MSTPMDIDETSQASIQSAASSPRRSTRISSRASTPAPAPVLARATRDATEAVNQASNTADWVAAAPRPVQPPTDGSAFDALAHISSSAYNNSRTATLASPVPDVCRTAPCCLGIDEAGRGPVLGPMVYGISYCPLSDDPRLRQMGFDDSKKLDEPTRRRLFDDINKANDFMGFSVCVISPQDISSSMLRRAKYNLNALSHDTAMSLVQRALDDGVNIAKVFVDTVGTAETYQEKLSERFPGIEFKVSAKADSLFPIVSAASICAKVVRDHVLDIWQFSEPHGSTIGRDFGCGYPSDPVTKQWLQTNMDSVFGFPGVVRFSWGTCKNILIDRAVNVTWEDDGEDEDDERANAKKSNHSILEFVKPTAPKRHRYFIERKLEIVQDLR
ncbi:ribonuclease H2 [Capsaspora owczarzaki ATCC 30864]|uniref:Ribonuclease n=1 Tax=Capsaspora owczarzaki (strain ATCC 30864) TaxID=595528 RepID=A0A0D2X292_CAPO3|nr:ribonuclease H2 [Capsaspora owczarzaki ATCC 30864]KJE92154.1 ribonuclease H2 [Capsaspora owczarzaki ATCC 30864]|eukprot:XP_004364012.1 ribonuclease H2 [Capsaspora owczarzaki ATCC 30864]